jgi:hypothetical protein
LTTVLFSNYIDFGNENTVHVRARGQRYVVGHTLFPEMKKHIDYLRPIDYRQYSKAEMLHSVTADPSDFGLKYN